jgi:hypothetical protein
MNQERPSATGEPKDRDADRELGGSTSASPAGATTGTTADDAYWRDNYQSRPYIDGAYGYDDYGPAYRYGAEAYGKHRDRAFDDVEGDLSAGWERAKAGSRLTWERAKHAVRDAWDRLAHAGDRGSDRYVG